MPQVTVSIDGKTYRMACDTGQEAHLEELASRLDSYVSHLKTSFGEIGDQRLTVMAGIMVMDELVELQKRVSSLEDELTNLRKTRDEAALKAQAEEATIAQNLTGLADRLEGLAAKFTQPSD